MKSLREHAISNELRQFTKQIRRTIISGGACFHGNADKLAIAIHESLQSIGIVSFPRIKGSNISLYLIQERLLHPKHDSIASCHGARKHAIGILDKSRLQIFHLCQIGAKLVLSFEPIVLHTGNLAHHVTSIAKEIPLSAFDAVISGIHIG